MERRNDAFDEFLIDPVPQAAHSSLSLSGCFSVTNALSEKRHEDLLDMLINEEATPPLRLGCPKQHFHNDVSRPSSSSGQDKPLWSLPSPLISSFGSSDQMA